MSGFRIHHLVDREFAEVRAWYGEHSPRAAEHFVSRFLVALARIKSRPTAHALWVAPFRRVRLVRFPYIVLFHEDRSIVSVLALVHERREPRRICASTRQRLRELK